MQERALAIALKASPPAPSAGASVALTRRLAQLIDLARGEDDEVAVILKLQAAYRAALSDLRLVPRAAGGGDTPAAPAPADPSSLRAQRDEVTARRAARAP